MPVLIAGATGNVGFAAAVALAERGVAVALLGRHADRLHAKAALIRTRVSAVGAPLREDALTSLVVDFADTDSVRRAAAEALHRFATIDGLVHSAGVFLQDGPTVLPTGHEVMFATNVPGPFLFTELILERMAQSGALVSHVIAPFQAKRDWSDLETITNHRPMRAFNRTKVCNRLIAGEMSRRHANLVSHVAFDPTFVIDRSDLALADRWPKGLTGLTWRTLSLLLARPPAVAGEPLAALFTQHPNRASLNGKLYRLGTLAPKPDAAMHDTESAGRLWDRLSSMIAD